MTHNVCQVLLDWNQMYNSTAVKSQQKGVMKQNQQNTGQSGTQK